MINNDKLTRKKNIDNDEIRTREGIAQQMTLHKVVLQVCLLDHSDTLSTGQQVYRGGAFYMQQTFFLAQLTDFNKSSRNTLFESFRYS